MCLYHVSWLCRVQGEKNQPTNHFPSSAFRRASVTFEVLLLREEESITQVKTHLLAFSALVLLWFIGAFTQHQAGIITN